MKNCSSLNTCSSPKICLFRINEHDILECKRCGHQYIILNENMENHVSNIYADAYFFEGKNGYPNYLEDKEILINHGIYYAQLMSKYKSAGSVFDVGCAAGFILKGFEINKWTCFGLEPNKTMAEYGRKELQLKIEVGSLESFQSDEKFDLITLIQVIGHFYDIDAAMHNVFTLLKPGGFVLVEWWNRASLYAKLSGKYWHVYSPPSVIHWFSDNTLNDLFSQHHLRFIDKGYPKKQISLKHALSLADEKTPGFIGKKKIFNYLCKKFGKLIFNYPPLDLKWYLFQKEAEK